MIELGSVWIAFFWNMYGLISIGYEPDGICGAWTLNLLPMGEEEDGTYWIVGHHEEEADGLMFHRFGLGPLLLITWIGMR